MNSQIVHLAGFEVAVAMPSHATPLIRAICRLEGRRLSISDGPNLQSARATIADHASNRSVGVAQNFHLERLCRGTPHQEGNDKKGEQYGQPNTNASDAARPSHIGAPTNNKHQRPGAKKTFSIGTKGNRPVRWMQI
jgi:hypothetical protein